MDNPLLYSMITVRVLCDTSEYEGFGFKLLKQRLNM